MWGVSRGAGNNCSSATTNGHSFRPGYYLVRGLRLSSPSVIQYMDRVGWILRTVLPVSPWSMLPTPVLDSPQAVVLIGVDTGMGREAVKRLVEAASQGKQPRHRLYAGCLTASGANELEKLGDGATVRTFRIDVTSQNSVDEAVRWLNEREPEGVFCACNVAGGMFGGPVEWTAFEVFEREIALNYFGLLRVARGLVPLLRRYGPGARFVAVTSTIALMPSFPGLAGYASSKSAADTLLNCLRAEIGPFGVDVINVCPGITRTPFLSGGLSNQERAWQSASPEVKAAYGKAYSDWWNATMTFGVAKLAQSPDDATSCLVDAVSSRYPKTRYYTGSDARLIARWAVHAPDWAWDAVVGALLSAFGRPPVAAASTPRRRLSGDARL